jgi:predicted RNase H-like HicB family nuclease
MIDLGINSDSIKYEVALDALGGDLQPFMEAIRLEKEKANPSAAAITYFEMRMAAIDELQQELRPADLDTINQILDPNNRLFRLGKWVRYPVTIEPDGQFLLVKFLDVPEATTQGNTFDEALEMAKDALESSLEFYREKGQPFPLPSDIKDGQPYVQILLP